MPPMEFASTSDDPEFYREMMGDNNPRDYAKRLNAKGKEVARTGKEVLETVNPADPVAIIGGVAGKSVFKVLKSFFGRLFAKSIEKAVVEIRIATKIEKQMGKRGWDEDAIQKLVNDPVKTGTTVDTRWGAGGVRNNDPATAYFDRNNHYVVRCIS